MITNHLATASGKIKPAFRYLGHWTFVCTFFLSLSVWLWDPVVDAIISGEALSRSSFFEPSPIELYIRSLLSKVILLFGGIASYLYVRLLAEQKTLRENQLLVKSIVDSEPECVKLVSIEGNILSMNPAGLEMLEVNNFADIKGAEAIKLVAPDHREIFRAFHERIIQGAKEQLEFDIITGNGTRKTLHSHAAPLRNASGEITAHLSITRDITKSKALNDQLRYQASHDQITGLVNRGEFELQLTSCIGRAATKNCTHAVLFMDLDQFKVINDTCGHLAGDALLKKIGQLLTKNVRQQDTVARLGGDEFALLLEYCSADDALAHANKIRTSIEAMDFYWEDRIFKTTASIGLVIVDETTSSVTEVLRQVDSACYVAKDRGRNRIFLLQADEEATAIKHGEMNWVAKIHEGIREQRFCLYAQMIESLGDGTNSRHAEILVRYRDESGDLVPPGAFLPAAERYGVISRLDRFVVEQTLLQLTQQPALLAQIDKFCINLSGQSLAEEEFLEFVVAHLAQYHDLVQHICFEITETAAINDMSTANLFIGKIRELGCTFSLDDFGSGLSSFGYLKNLPVDFVKIDGEFVRDITSEPMHLAMIRSINEIAHLMNKKTVAEFVENDEIKAMLRGIGVDYAQGYGVHRPQPLEELQAWSKDLPQSRAS